MKENDRLNIALAIICKDRFNCGSYFRPDSESHNLFKELTDSGIHGQYHRSILRKFYKDGLIEILPTDKPFDLPQQLQVVSDAKILNDSGGYGYAPINYLAWCNFLLALFAFLFGVVQWCDNRNLEKRIQSLESLHKQTELSK